MAAAEATAEQGWSSLPEDLVNRVADCLLATNDLDYYMDLRAVCHHWRSSTADPRTSHGDARFHPTRWIVLDELSKPESDDTRLFVNAATGRFLRRRLPLLRDHHLVASTTGGFLVLADREPPHAARVLNPFTASLIRFMAAFPNAMHMAADVVGPLPTLVVVAERYSDDSFSFLGISFSGDLRYYHADPESEHFHIEDLDSTMPVSDVAFLGAIASSYLALRCLAVKLGPGEMLHLRRSQQQGVHLFRMQRSAGVWREERVYTIGGRALFVGTTRCISIHAGSFPSIIEANCVYYTKQEETEESFSSHIYYMYDLAHDKEERIAESDVYPATILQVLMQYTPPLYEPAWNKFVTESCALVALVENFGSSADDKELLDYLADLEDDDED